MSRHHVSHNHYHLSRLSDTSRIYWIHTIRSFTVSLILVLIPIFLSKIGLSFQQILLFFILEGVVWLLMLFPVAKYIHRVGIHNLMLLSMIAKCFFIISLIIIPHYFLIGYSLLIISSGCANLYWLALRFEFFSITQGQEAGHKIGLTNALALAGQALAPAIGGIIGSFYGMNWVYAIALILYIIVVLMLIKRKDIKHYPKFQRSKLSIQRIKGDLAANAGSAFDDFISAVIWPLMIFIFITSYASIGILSAIAVISSILISLWVGDREAIKGEKRYIQYGTNLLSFTGILRTIASSFSHVSAVNFLTGIGQALYMTPFYSRYYKNASKESVTEYLFFMQAACAIGWIVYPLILLILSFIFNTQIVLLIGAIIAIPAVLCIQFMRSQNTHIYAS